MPGIPKAKLDEWRALAEKATPGPWRLYGPGTSDPTEIMAPDPDYPDPDFSVVVFGGDLNRDETDDDAAFILASREAVPALLDEVERLTLAAGEGMIRGATATAAGLRADMIRVADVADRAGAVATRDALRQLADGLVPAVKHPAEAEAESMRALLREIEWSGTWMHGSYEEEIACCPSCRGLKEAPWWENHGMLIGHAPACALAAFLK